MANVFTQLAPLIQDAVTASLRVLTAPLRQGKTEPWQSEYVMRDDDTGCYAQRVYALAPQVWERLSTQPPN